MPLLQYQMWLVSHQGIASWTSWFTKSCGLGLSIHKVMLLFSDKAFKAQLYGLQFLALITVVSEAGLG